jgi:hypothetical protein
VFATKTTLSRAHGTQAAGDTCAPGCTAECGMDEVGHPRVVHGQLMTIPCPTPTAHSSIDDGGVAHVSRKESDLDTYRIDCTYYTGSATTSSAMCVQEAELRKKKRPPAATHSASPSSAALPQRRTVQCGPHPQPSAPSLPQHNRTFMVASLTSARQLPAELSGLARSSGSGDVNGWCIATYLRGMGVGVKWAWSRLTAHERWSCMCHSLATSPGCVV